VYTELDFNYKTSRLFVCMSLVFIGSRAEGLFFVNLVCLLVS